MIQVLYFAALRELVGRDEEFLQLPQAVLTVRDFVSHMQQVRPELAGKLVSVRIAVDETFAEDSELLGDPKTIALIPPVAGG